ncbi:hydroxymethylglutaryl-CoA reductase, degradative [Salibacter sp.]|uniref:hydroxymethylglutaryl-CoA reductase, degradative n=1 Tax=Salibacter sp. TaxID=2010995 RepID=UPI0028700859|nr:hydroxymethylglutaryl-CoA reductase, degradative [Salibacter sp.]MDR9399410.1 hydroxymethylglutaryl-CoA reductase, degradative [Salibacter sp.]MDR9488287.1 hydroxymethylglutaryl-CoA reductase, degradative [Salibacter sp.]
MSKKVKGFSKMTKEAKIEWLTNNYFNNPDEARETLQKYWHKDPKTQQLHDEFIENTLTNYFLPFGVAPNFKINDKVYAMPMAIEESSVVAAAAKAASFWYDRGGFKSEVISTKKVGHVHFAYYGDYNKLWEFFNSVKDRFYADTAEITKNMRKRGGGIEDLMLINKTFEEPNYYQIKATFETVDSMGANFINTCLEQFANTLQEAVKESDIFTEKEKDIQIIMCILSNYTPECLVRSEVSCPVEFLETDGVSAEEFVEKFERAVHVARIEPYRATTHNKGIMNGIDAVVIATGNDFRAIEAACHTYAARSGQYRSLTDCAVEDGIFKFWIEVPMALGTVGGLTNLHPVVKLAHELLDNPSAKELMGIVAASGLAQNFGALRALVTTGIQQGHMKMHLLNILNKLEATNEEKEEMKKFFKDKVPHYNMIVNKFCEMRGVSSVEELKK